MRWTRTIGWAAGLLATCAACSSTIDGASAVDAGAATDAARCDPSTLEDAGNHDAPVAVDGPYVIDLSLGVGHRCAVMSDGTVRCYGLNYAGQLGLGPGAPNYVAQPTTVPSLTEVEQVVALISEYTCTRHRDGTVRCWGSNRYGLLGTGHEGDERCDPERASPCRTQPTLVPTLTDVIQLAAGSFSACALRRDGTVWCWGRTAAMPESATPTRVESLRDIAWIGPYNFDYLARTRDGHYVIWAPGRPTPAIPQGVTLDSNDDNAHLCYRLADTSVRCLGQNAYGKLGNGTSTVEEVGPTDPGLCGVRSVVTGGYHSCALMTDRTVQCWGDAYGREAHEQPDQCVGYNGRRACTTRPARIPMLDQVEQLFPGTWTTCARRLDRTLWCWGSGFGTVPVLTAW